MNVSKAFEEFHGKLRVSDPAKISSRYKLITKILNKKYWDSESDTKNSLQVGSYGRGTATQGISDLDMVMVLPPSVKRRIDKHDGNGQSALLQEVKKIVGATYPTTKIRGDGQVVVVTMRDFTIEVLPAFERDDGSFLFPNARDGGSWKVTNPRAEIAALNKLNNDSNGSLKALCRMARAWKDKADVAIPGLLIDTLAFNFLSAKTEWQKRNFGEFDRLVAAFFAYLTDEDPGKAYWLAPGSRQLVYKKDSFTRKAQTAVRLCEKAIKASEEPYAADKWRDVFGPKFPPPAQLGDKASVTRAPFRDTEEFIEDRFPVSIQGHLSIDGEVSQDGYRPNFLSRMLANRWMLKRGRKLCFFITECNITQPYRVFWKVRNVGARAEELDQIRGEIVEDSGSCSNVENSKFHGPHWVECYIVKNGTCVARARIDVPIEVAG